MLMANARYWLLFGLCVVALSRTLDAGRAALDGIAGGWQRLVLWVFCLAALGFLLALEDYRRHRSRGKVKQPIRLFERLLGPSANREAKEGHGE